MKAVRSLALLAALILASLPVRAHEVEGLGKDLFLLDPFPYPIAPGLAATPTSTPLPLVGHLLLPGPNGDLWAHKNTVVVGSWRGSGVGVKLIDISDPARPALAYTMTARPGTTYEDPMILEVKTPTFQGDLLAVGLQYGSPGAEFWDITDPRRPELLSFFPTPGSAGVHELFLTRQGDRVLALLATLSAGLRIVDVTNPREPRLLSQWQIERNLGIHPLLGAGYPATFCHSVSASADGTRAYLSYWDAGAVILDISNPAQPRFLGRTVYAVDEEGDTHSAVEADGGRLLITADEDLDPTPAANTIRVIAPASRAGLYGAIELGWTKQLAGTPPVRGEVVDLKVALPGASLAADPRGKIVLVDPASGRQGQIDQVLWLQGKGAIAVLFSTPFYRDGRPSPDNTVPGVSLHPESADALRQALKAGERAEVELAPGRATWGYVRLWDVRDPAKPVQVGAFTTPETSQYPLPQRGWFTVHNPFVRGTRLYASWYTNGIRVIDIADPTRPQEIAHFLPPKDPAAPITMNADPLVWGVVEHNGLLLMSDMQSGLWIVRDAP
jgi:hypothetical protein